MHRMTVKFVSSTFDAIKRAVYKAFDPIWYLITYKYRKVTIVLLSIFYIRAAYLLFTN